MIKMKNSNFLAILLGLSILVMPVLLRADEYKKSYNESYSVNKDAELVIDNKFGDLHLQNWEKNEVSIEVTVTVEASSESKAQKVLDNIDVKISGSRDKVEAMTLMDDGISGKVEFSIDYKVMMPATLEVSLVNKFGTIYLEEVTGKAYIELAYGELEASSLSNSESSLDIKFGEGDVSYFGGNAISVSYAELDLEEGGHLKLTSRFSEADITRLNSLELDSQYDEIRLEKVGEVNAKTRFSEMSIEDLSGNFMFDAQYGGISVDMVSEMTGTCKVDNSFADVELNFAPGVSFELDAVAKFGEVKFDRDVADIDHSEDGFTTNVYKGKVGKGSPGAKLVIECRNSDVRLSY